MLKALELVGFKSFADKTRLEFPHGVTVVVGPNGSGKSNIVDAIKWVLGEQSVKSLRGKEMADVIFNGSSTRRAINSAEVTLTFDNTNRLLPLDTSEVHITRRVYRSGEGEYLINRNPARLRDIRDLLSGTGMGTQAYSIIEQGKVDLLLQASPRERRLIFEEAAGISRFKTKKLEALRRLERVDQNLLRLSDIVDEVDVRLRSVRLQAGKAQRFKEHTDRLQDLRTQAGLVDWRRLSERLAVFDKEIASLAEQRDAAVAVAENAEAQLLGVDGQISDANEAVRASQGHIAANRESIATYEATLQHERARGADLEQEIGRIRKQVVAMNARAAELQQQFEATRATVATAKEKHQQIAVRLAEGQETLAAMTDTLERFRADTEDRRAACMDRMRTAVGLGSEIRSLENQVAAAATARQRCKGRIGEQDAELASLAEQLKAMRIQREELAVEAEEQEHLLMEAEARLADIEGQFATRRDELADLRRRHGATAERISVLEELQHRHEGVSAGVKEVLAEARLAGNGPYAGIRGLVADLLRVSIEIAPLIEVALGDAAQHIVASPSDALLAHLKSQASRLAGRVGFVWLTDTAAHIAKETDLEGHPGVMGRADRFVEAEPRCGQLPERLLGRTWIVETLDQAMQLARSVTGCDFVTLAGERVTAAGTLMVGPQHGTTGLISRRSQLRELNIQQATMEEKIARADQVATSLREQITKQKQKVEAGSGSHGRVLAALSEHRFKIGTIEQEQSHTQRQRTTFQLELQATNAQHDAALKKLTATRTEHERVESGLAAMQCELSETEDQIEKLETQRQTQSRETTQVEIELAKSEERLRALRSRVRQFEEGRQERCRALDESREQLALCLKRAERSRWNLLQTGSKIAELYLRKEHDAAETVERIEKRELLRGKHYELTAESQKVRARARRLDGKIHAQDLAANEIRHERDDLAGRLREDYKIELAELEQEPTEQQRQQRDEVQKEIDELRRKIGGLGNINLEALGELDDLDSRHQTLANQYNDLATAKASLDKIIDRINADSRRLFAETLETVKNHFQQLFRDLFGGGQGDIVLDEGVDILESGIEIVARPPGKEPRNISLLSGGEKTLTCVALLLAVFRSRPSPFCVLDEVDAALDEANIDRFTQVVHGFLDWTQFIIVTHSKKTMICADTIYGITMQESGISKQVSVRFEDVSDDGEILQERLDAETTNDDEPRAA